ncbi:MAG: PQQ-binding-like beta-propeller repeat protein [Bacteroidota bacterium]|nr:PQQ-binding-like beta-propeller repeat protein [Bacteroidota bacterium]
MKHFYLTALFLLTLVSVYPQSELQVTYNPKIIGRNLKTNTDIRGIEYVFPERIDRSYFNPISNTLTVELRGVTRSGKYLDNTGNVLLYDLENRKVKWSQKINYQVDHIRQENDLMIFTKFNTTYRINLDNGENKWGIKNKIHFIDGKQNIGIGYRTALFSKENALDGINLQTGEVVWSRELSNYWGWNGVFYLNDSVILIASQGLHAINLKDGKGWDYDAKSVNMGFSAVVTNIYSNLLADSSSIYQASKENIARLDHQGNVMWSQSLPNDMTSNSSIFINDSLIYMINKGSGYNGFKTISYGKPFLAAFNLKTGNSKFFSTIEGKKQQIKDFKITKDTAVIVFKDKISKYSLIDGSLIAEKTFQLDSLTELGFFVGRKVYIKTDSTYKSLAAIDSTQHYLWTESGKIITVNKNLEVVNQIDPKQIYVFFLKNKDYRFIARDNETIVLDKDDKIVAELQISSNAILLGTKLYDVQKQTFIEINVDELIRNNFKQSSFMAYSKH